MNLGRGIAEQGPERSLPGRLLERQPDREERRFAERVRLRLLEDAIQAMALAYAEEVDECRPDGPVMIGGNCQGALIALAMAQHGGG